MVERERDRVLARQERTNYPITLSVDDLGEGFALTAQTDRRIDPQPSDRLSAHGTGVAGGSAGASAADSGVVACRSCRTASGGSSRGVQCDAGALSARSRLIHELFEEQVERTPDAVAVVYEGRVADLCASSTPERISWRATCDSAESDPDELVAICVERSVEMVVGVLGI